MEFLKKLNKLQLTALGGSVALVLGLLIWIVLSSSTPDMKTLYTNLSLEDSEIISSRLYSMGVRYNMSGDHKQINVPEDKMLQLRMLFAQEGLPSNGQVVGYEIFDKQDSFGTSQFVYNVNYIRALEGELARTISSLSLVSSARVHLVIPKKELFSRSSYTPSASVILKVKGGNQLSKQEILSIAHIVATAVPELSISNITIVDNKGSPLKLSTDEDNSTLFSGFGSGALEYKLGIENRMIKAVEDLLSRSMGIGKVVVNVTADMDFDKEVINSEDYDPEKQVVRSKRSTEERENDFASRKNVSVANNIPNSNQQVGRSDPTRNKERSDELINYDVSKTVSNKVKEYGRIERLSIAVLIDGKYIQENGVQTYKERTPEEIAQVKVLVASAVGFDEARGDKLEVVNLPFNQENIILEDEGIFAFIKNDPKGFAQIIIIGIIVILILLLVVRPIVMRMISNKASDQISDSEESLQIGVTDNGDMLNTKSAQGEDERDEKSNDKEIAEQLNNIVSQNPEDTAAIIKGWIYGK
ncbi:MAG: flagellar basal-body MS-ring/collar protein FliF [Proteobacteria bacterium]|nr:flagellar basal-body MS-ring/collar protein FliF [Pseudomonadota bacterium]